MMMWRWWLVGSVCVGGDQVQRSSYLIINRKTLEMWGGHQTFRSLWRSPLGHCHVTFKASEITRILNTTQNPASSTQPKTHPLVSSRMNGALVQAAPLWSTMLLCIPSALHHDVGIHAEETILSQCSGASVHVQKQSGDHWTSYCLCCSVVHLSWGQRRPTLNPAVLKPGWFQQQPFWSLLTTTSAPMHEDKLMIPAETSGHALCMWQDHMKRCSRGR